MIAIKDGREYSTKRDRDLFIYLLELEMIDRYAVEGGGIFSKRRGVREYVTRRTFHQRSVLSNVSISWGQGIEKTFFLYFYRTGLVPSDFQGVVFKRGRHH